MCALWLHLTTHVIFHFVITATSHNCTNLMYDKTPPYDHPVNTTISLLRLLFCLPNEIPVISLFTTWLIRPARYCDQGPLFGFTSLYCLHNFTWLMGRLKLVSHVVQTHLVSEQGTHWTRQTKKIIILDDVSSLFVLSQCVSCSPARCFCTT